MALCSMPRKRGALRDTAKDIILGSAPSGAGPREPREGIAQPAIEQIKVISSAVPSTPSSTDSSTIDKLHNLFVLFQRQFNDFVQASEQTQSRLATKQDDLDRRLTAVDTIAHQVATVQTQVTDQSSKWSSLCGQVESLEGAISSQADSLLSVRQALQVPSPQVSSMIERAHSRLNEASANIEQFKAAIDNHMNMTQQHTHTIASLEERLQKNEAWMGTVTQQLDHQMSKTEQAMESMNQMETRFNKALDVASNKRTQAFERLEHELAACVQSSERTRNMQQMDRSKYKQRLEKMNEALAYLERNLETGTSKMTTDIKSRHLHEKALIEKASQMERRLLEYIKSLKRAINKSNARVPAVFDVNALRREMEGIAAEHNNISMKGLLKLEQQMNDMQQAFTREHNQILGVDKYPTHAEQLNAIKQTIETASQQLRHSVTQQEHINTDQVAIKKLAESIATVKVYLERKITDEKHQVKLGACSIQQSSLAFRENGPSHH